MGHRASPSLLCFNPHPPLLAGETSGGSGGRAAGPSFNPHPPLLAGETFAMLAQGLHQRFNPHPPLLAGETMPHKHHGSGRSFNPHPPLLAGETNFLNGKTVTDEVSIHTRHYWRVKQGVGGIWYAAPGFNPHPPLLAGETPDCPEPVRAGRVSIHTRHYWRVKHVISVWRNKAKEFQSTPAITGG